MRRIVIWVASTAVAFVLLLSYRTSLSGAKTTNVVAQGTQAPGIVGGNAPSSRPSGTPRSKASRGSTKAAPNPAGTSGRAVTANGSVVQTVWGPVQVQVHITGSKIIDVTTLIYPTGTGRDQEINSYALPILRQQAVAAQSAHIDGVSGATYTSDGYRSSLQAALDSAHFGA
jgi:uncharacterized protein with FMN-binding domain